MNFFKNIFGISSLSLVISDSTTNASDFSVGQVWKYKTRPSEEKSRLIIVSITPISKSEVAYGIFIEKVKIKSSGDGIQDYLSYVPISKEALNRSVVTLIERRSELPDYEAGFNIWKTAFDKGEAGVYSITVAELLSL